MNDLFLKALRCENRSRAPIWLMRQAGRYMPQYRAIRAKHPFLDMVHDPELAAEVTMLPVKHLGVDAAILFSDILVIPEALRVGLHFDDGIGPIIDRPLQTAADIDALPKPDIKEALQYVAQAIRLLRPQLKVPLIGFCGAPFTVASYMIEGKSSKDLRTTKQWMMKDPKSFHTLLEKISRLTIDYLEMQIEAGVQAVQIFDSWANVLSHGQFREFSLTYFKMILEGIKSKNVPAILFCRGSSVFASQLAEIQPSAISVDWNADLMQMRKVIPRNIALQGNLDPDVLYAPYDLIKRETKALLKGMKGEPGYIFNLGHGLLPDIPYENVQALVDIVRQQ